MLPVDRATGAVPPQVPLYRVLTGYPRCTPGVLTGTHGCVRVRVCTCALPRLDTRCSGPWPHLVRSRAAATQTRRECTLAPLQAWLGLRSAAAPTARAAVQAVVVLESRARWPTRTRSMRAERTSTIPVSTHATARSRSRALTRPHARARKHTHARTHTGRHARVHTRALAHTNTPAHALSLDALTRSKRCCVRIRRCA